MFIFVLLFSIGEYIFLVPFHLHYYCIIKEGFQQAPAHLVHGSDVDAVNWILCLLLVGGSFSFLFMEF